MKFLPAPDDARLMSIGINPHSPHSAFRPALDLREPYPKINGVEPGYYNMQWNLEISEDSKLCVRFDVLGTDGEVADSLSLPAMQYFSYALVTQKSLMPPLEQRPVDEALRKLFSDHARESFMALANMLSHKQHQDFETRISQWLDFSENERNLDSIASMQFMISGMFWHVNPRYTCDETLVILPENDGAM